MVDAILKTAVLTLLLKFDTRTRLFYIAVP